MARQNGGKRCRKRMSQSLTEILTLTVYQLQIQRLGEAIALNRVTEDYTKSAIHVDLKNCATLVTDVLSVSPAHPPITNNEGRHVDARSGDWHKVSPILTRLELTDSCKGIPQLPSFASKTQLSSTSDVLKQDVGELAIG
ncbi:hypothetical protein TcWFU_005679 [Taenia crassiceps]|uniref:Uncharacterized protein n=1 Tax=Taenia crassiceps TaxID=6207 RepID=A0ABR4QAY1_9CEST